MSAEVFSTYVASLDAQGEPPDLHSYDAIREELRTLLVGELRRRGLWTAPPSFLGLEGATWRDGTLNDLVTDAYTFNFIDRLRGLRNQLRVKKNIRGLVVRNVRNFLHQLQKKADPIGYRVFGRLRDAIEENIDNGRLFLLNSGDAETKLDNRSLLGFHAGLATVTPRTDLEDPVKRWNDDLLPELITAEGRAVPKVVDQLATKVASLKEDRVTTFRLGDLITVLKNDVRDRWEDIWNVESGEVANPNGSDGTTGGPPVPVVRPAENPDWPRRQALILECVAAGIDEGTPKSRRDLWSLWLWIRSSRLIPEEQGPLPPFAELGRQLELTRDRVRQLFERLWPIVQACLRSAGHGAAICPAAIRPSNRLHVLTHTPADPSLDAVERRGLRIARRGR